MKDKLVEYNGILYPTFTRTGWTLCVGAGISLPLFYSWEELAKKLLLECCPKLLKDEDYVSQLIKNYGPDVIIQGAQNLSEMTDEEFAGKLEKILYEKIKQKLSKDECEIVKKVFNNDNIARIPKFVWKQFCIIRDKYFNNTSSYIIAKQLIKTFNTPAQPNAIISFNAEPLLYSILSSFDFQQQNSKGTSLMKNLDVIISSISNFNKNRISYIYNHGFIPMKGNSKDYLGNYNRLVFKESEYIQLSNYDFSWPSTSFFSEASRRPILFIGLSFCDSNIRKWLTWVQKSRHDDIININKSSPSTRHFWIEKRPANEEQCRLLESLVFHLGVRIIWLNDWGDLESTLTKILRL